MATKKHLSRGLDNRTRVHGEIHKKRKDTMVKTLRKTYGEHFASGYKPDTTLGEVLKKEKVDSLHHLLQKKK
jgi:hypothetical protein